MFKGEKWRSSLSFQPICSELILPSALGSHQPELLCQVQVTELGWMLPPCLSTL